MVVAVVRTRPDRGRRDAAWALLARALEAGPPDLVVVPATTLATLRQEDWDVPAAIEHLAGVVSLSWPTARPAARTVIVLVPRGCGRRSWCDDDPDDDPPGPPEWARVVEIG